MDCVKQYEKHLQNEKRKIFNIVYKQGRILHQLKEFEEFIDTLFKRLKMSKRAISFKINLYKLLKKFPLLKHCKKSMHYFKNFFRNIKLTCRINGDQLKKYLRIKMLHFLKIDVHLFNRLA